MEERYSKCKMPQSGLKKVVQDSVQTFVTYYELLFPKTA